ncbi:hypothetical protein BDZ45DRAFT_767708 [Acephala macrosclerotiorum]|nr:hypothetical protein BDZ45DRAFT_767708 [Acephala macrosclerotiorum]
MPQVSKSSLVHLRRLDPKNADALAAEIVSKASGVFLWVVLAVKSLLDGLMNRDRVSDLQKRLQLLPSDLEELYKHMLFRHISPFYYEQSAQILRIFRTATVLDERLSREALELITLVFADEEDESLALTAKVRPLMDEELLLRCNETTDRLKSRCAGLLEVSGKTSDPLDLKVNYLHRTVQDFLKKPDIWDLVMARAGTAFDPDECLIKSYILQLKFVMMSSEGDRFQDVSDLVHTALKYARRSRDFSLQSNELLLDELDKMAAYHWMSVPRKEFVGTATIDRRRTALHWANELSVQTTLDNPESAVTLDDFLSLAIEYGLLEILLDAGADPNTLACGIKEPQRGVTYYSSAPLARLQLVTPLAVVSTIVRFGPQVPFPDKELELRLQSSGARCINTWIDIRDENVLDDKAALQASVDEHLCNQENVEKKSKRRSFLAWMRGRQ